MKEVQAALIRDGSSISAWTLSQLRAWWDMHSPGNPQTGMERFVESDPSTLARVTRLEAGRVNRVADKVGASWLKTRLRIIVNDLERIILNESQRWERVSASNAGKPRTAVRSVGFEQSRTSKQVILHRLLQQAARLPAEVRDEELLLLVDKAEKYFQEAPAQ